MGHTGKLGDGGDALQFNGDGGRKPVDLHGGSTRLVVLEIFRIKAVEGVEVAVHVHQKNGDIHHMSKTEQN